MADVVEVSGAPGTGKSSLVGALAGSEAGGRRLVDARALLRVPRLVRAGAAGAPGGGRSGGTSALPRPLERLLRRDLQPEERRSLVAERAASWSGLLELLARAELGRDADVTTDPGRAALRRLYAPGWIAATLELRALADGAPDDVLPVLDEGLVQRTRIVLGVRPDAAALRAFVAALPAPRLVVHLTGPVEVLAARVSDRAAAGRTIDRHAGTAPDDVAASLRADVDLLERAVTELEAAGQDVLRLDVTDGRPDELAARVRARLSEAG
jgi:hypothetical protein